MVDGRHEAVSHPGKGFHVARLIGNIAKGLPQLINRCIEAMFEVAGSYSRPKLSLKFLTSDQLAGLIHERSQNCARL
jgi:hypothetical protein